MIGTFYGWRIIWMAGKNVQSRKKDRAEIIIEYENVIRDYSMRGYTIKDASVSIIKASIIGTAIASVLVIAGYISFHAVHPDSEFEYSSFLFLLLLVISIPIHELLHAIGFVLLSRGKWQRDVRIGVMWEALTPYCTCSKPMRAIGYALASLCPFVLLGILPYIASFLSGDQLLMWLGLTNVLFSGGDLLIFALLMIKHPKIVLDNPKECGFYILHEPCFGGDKN
jgi:hypothetical protein